MSDRKTQQAVVYNLIVLGEAATRIASEYPEFATVHPEIPWQVMRGMRTTGDVLDACDTMKARRALARAYAGAPPARPATQLIGRE